jgi:hypothetical protein
MSVVSAVARFRYQVVDLAGFSLKGRNCWDSSAVLERIRFMRERISVAYPRGRLAWLVAIALVAAMAAPATGYAGGPFEQIVGIGARAQSTQLKLAPSGTRSEDSLRGRRTHAPGVGYVRIYTLIGGLPGIPGRYYPTTGVLCLSWNEQPANCTKLESPGRRLLAPLARLSRLHRPPTRLVGVTPATGVLRTANVHLGLELALARHPSANAQPPSPGALALTLNWRGPDANQRPEHVRLDARGVWAQGHLYPTPHGVWAYIAGNAPPHTTAGTTKPATRTPTALPLDAQIAGDLGVNWLTPARAAAGDAVQLGVSGYLGPRPWPALRVVLLSAVHVPRPRPCHGNGSCAPAVTPAAIQHPPFTIVGSIHNWRAHTNAVTASGSLRFRVPELAAGRYVLALFCPACAPGPRGSLIINPRLFLTIQ